MAGEWSIAQVLSHLGSQAEIFGAILEAVIEGSPIPGPDTFPPVWEAWDSRSPGAQVSDSVAANERFVRRVEGLSDAALDELHFSLFGMELDAAGFLRLRLSEHAVHSWDVAASLDPAATVADDAVALLVDTLPDLARRVGKTSAGPLAVRVVTSGPHRDLAVVVGDDVKVDPSDGTATDAVVRLPAEAWLRLVYGRLDERHTPAVEVDGDALTLDRLRTVFPGL